MSSLELKKSDSLEEKGKGIKEQLSKIIAGPYLLVFFVALLVRLWFAFFDGHECIVWSCDASEYLRCTQAIREVLQTLPEIWQSSLLYLFGMLPKESIAELHQAYEPIKGMAKQAGPIFPTFLTISYFLTATPITAENWFAPILIHSLFTSLTCVLMAYIAAKCWDKPTGILAGILAAFYPGFIVNSLRLYSESYATFWLVLVVALLVRMYTKGNWNHSLLLGVCLAILQGTRSALVLVSCVSTALLAVISGKKHRKKSILLLITGAFLVIGPSMVLQNLTLGKSSMVQDRVSQYNVFVGMDVNAQGWLSYPYPDGTGIEKSNLLQLLKRRFDESHSRFIKLSLDKPLRLFKFPWNDFRTPIGVFGQDMQVLFHQTCLLLAAIGICASWFNLAWSDEKEKQKLVSRSFLFSILALHIVYFAFITVPRYGLTSMPIVIIFASAGLAFLFNKLKEKSNLKVMIALVAASLLVLSLGRVDYASQIYGLINPPANGQKIYMAIVFASILKAIFASLFFVLLFMAVDNTSKASRALTSLIALLAIPFIALPLRAHSRLLEWQAPIDSKTGIVSQELYLPKERLEDFKNHKAYLLIDSDNWKGPGQSLELKINGQSMDNNYLPIMPFSQNLGDLKLRGGSQYFYECEDIYRAVLDACGGKNLDIRQWFLVPVPANIISRAIEEESYKLIVQTTSKEGRNSNLYGSYMPEANVCYIPSVARYSWEKCLYGVENDHGLTDSRFDEKYKLVKSTSTNQDLSSQAGLQTGSYNLRLLLSKNEGTSWELIKRTESEIQKKSLNTTVGTSINDLPEYSEETVWAIKVEGTIDSNQKKTINVPLDIRLQAQSVDSEAQNIYRSPWVPTSVEITKGQNEFAFSIPLKPSAIKDLGQIDLRVAKGGKADSTQFFGTDYKPVSKRSSLTNSEYEKTIANDLNWKSLTLSIYKIPGNPISNGFEIF